MGWNDAIGTVGYRKGSPAVLYVLSALCVAVSLADIAISSGDSVFASAAALPSDFYALATAPWRILTYQFVHPGGLHLLFNLFVLICFGEPLLRGVCKAGTFISIFIAGALTGGVFYIFFYGHVLGRNGLLLGASASVMAVAVAAAMLCPRRKMSFPGHPRVIYAFIAVVLLCAFETMTVDTNIGGAIAHIGGGTGGFFCTLLILVRHRKSRERVGNNDSRACDTDIRRKIEMSGFSSLSDGEKKIVFDSSRETTVK